MEPVKYSEVLSVGPASNAGSRGGGHLLLSTWTTLIFCVSLGGEAIGP